MSLIFPYVLFPRFGWRPTFLIALAPIILVPLVISSLPESLRYLQLKGRTSEALETLKREGIIPEGVKEAPSAIPLRKYRLKEALRELWSKGLWRRTLLLWILWAVLVYTYHGIFIWLPTIYAREMGITVVRSIEWTLVVTLAQIQDTIAPRLCWTEWAGKRLRWLTLPWLGLAASS